MRVSVLPYYEHFVSYCKPRQLECISILNLASYEIGYECLTKFLMFYYRQIVRDSIFKKSVGSLIKLRIKLIEYW